MIKAALYGPLALTLMAVIWLMILAVPPRYRTIVVVPPGNCYSVNDGPLQCHEPRLTPTTEARF